MVVGLFIPKSEIALIIPKISFAPETGDKSDISKIYVTIDTFTFWLLRKWSESKGKSLFGPINYLRPDGG